MPDALERIERQLVDAAARRDAASSAAKAWPPLWRGRQVALAALATLTLAAGASAVTGVGPLGDVFDAEEVGLAPRPGAPSVTVTQQRPDGSQAAMRAYEDKNGALCIQSPPVAGRPESEVAVSCVPPTEVARAIERDGAFAATATGPEGSQFFGLVSGGTNALRVEVGDGPRTEAVLADEAIASFRAFVVALTGTAPDINEPAKLFFDDGRMGRWPPGP